MKNKIADLRNHLFQTIEGLLDQEKPLDIDRAKAVAEVAQVVINSAKVEAEFLREIGGNGTGFISEESPVKKLNQGTKVA